MAELFGNFGRSTLNGAVTDVATSWVVADGSKFPASGDFRVTCEAEIALCTARSGNTLTVTRGQESTTNVAHANGTIVRHAITAASLGAAVDERVATHAAAGDPHTGYVLESLLDAKGDLIAASADNTPAKLTVGADGTPLLADSTASAGLRYGLKLPTVRAVGASASGTGAVVPGLPAGHVANDILLLFVNSSNETVTAPAGYTQLGPQVGFGTAVTALSTRLAIFWKRDGGAESDPTVAGTGDHTLAQIIAVVGCPTTGDPFESVGQNWKRTASVTGTAEGGGTTCDACLVVNAWAHGIDSASAVFSAPVNADLGSLTEQIDVATADGTGGGIGVVTGTKADEGSFAGTTVTETSTTDVSSTFIMLPAGARPLSDRQVFITPGYADTWVKRSGAKVVDMSGIGGGASGSAGRNAATAAGGGGGGGGMFHRVVSAAADLAATMTVTAGAGGAATANVDGSASNGGAQSSVVSATKIILGGNGGAAAGVSATGSGGLGGNGGGRLGAATAAGVAAYSVQAPGGGTGGTTAGAGGQGVDQAGGAGAGGGTTQAASAGGASGNGGGGGGGGRANTNVGTGGASMLSSQLAGGATAGANGTDSPLRIYGGSGAAGGTSAAGPGGAGGWPGGGGGGGGSQAAAQRGGAGGDGVVTIITLC